MANSGTRRRIIRIPRALFLFTIGSQLNLKAFSSTSLMATAAVTTLLAIVTKLIGCGLPVLHDGPRAALQVGIGMIPRAEVGMIVAALGLRMGLLSEAGYSVVIVMAIGTTIVTPPMLRLQFRSAQISLAWPAEKLKSPIIVRLLRPLIGSGICALVALGSSVLFREHTTRIYPLMGFLLVVVVIARVYGRAAGMIGTLVSALIFATLLFRPLGSWVVLDDAARTSLGWMMLGGMALSYFLSRDKSHDFINRNQRSPDKKP
jgi:predicted Kef-type K+ transport protein